MCIGLAPIANVVIVLRFFEVFYSEFRELIQLCRTSLKGLKVLSWNGVRSSSLACSKHRAIIVSGTNALMTAFTRGVGGEFFFFGKGGGFWAYFFPIPNFGEDFRKKKPSPNLGNGKKYYADNHPPLAKKKKKKKKKISRCNLTRKN